MRLLPKKFQLNVHAFVPLLGSVIAKQCNSKRDTWTCLTEFWKTWFSERFQALSPKIFSYLSLVPYACNFFTVLMTSPSTWAREDPARRALLRCGIRGDWRVVVIRLTDRKSEPSQMPYWDITIQPRTKSLTVRAGWFPLQATQEQVYKIKTIRGSTPREPWKTYLLRKMHHMFLDLPQSNSPNLNLIPKWFEHYPSRLRE